MVEKPTSKTFLSLSVEQLRSIGPRNIARIHKLGIHTVRDLLWHFPARYEDYTSVIPIGTAEVGSKVSIAGEIVKISTRRIFPRRMTVTNAIIKDTSGAIRAVWFNQAYIENQLAEGTYVSLAGKVNLNKQGPYLSSPVYEKIILRDKQKAGSPTKKTDLKHTRGLIPIYPETYGITSKYLRFLIQPILQRISLEDPIPRHIIRDYNFLTLSNAIRLIHYPKTEEDSERAKERLAFDDLLLFQIRALLERRKINQLKSAVIPFNQTLIKSVIAELPFTLTQDQKVAAWEILQDLEKPYPMNRLLEGDVGSGKTVVALISAIQTAKAGYQTVFMAPTEVLAIQHFLTIQSLAKKSNIRIGLLTSSTAKLNDIQVKKSDLKKKVKDGSVDIVIGTHAIMQKDVEFSRLALLVIDEQHRFGVEQRAALLHREKEATIPHLLSMTATPIPRTLALTVFGDLDVSLIKEKPKNRNDIITQIISEKKRTVSYGFMREEAKKGRQIFVICPRIEIANKTKEAPFSLNKTSNRPISQSRLAWAEVKAVKEEFDRLSRHVFPDLRIVMLHGKMKSKEKETIMREFKNGWHDILVSTSVIEVGVDIPNATIMAIEGADRFGLAQLHQFRGRVGRGEHQSYCMLFTSSDGGNAKRLQALAECNDGFELAEKDMYIRGPGEFFGIKQSGLPDLTMAALANVELIKKARATARLLLKQDPSLKEYSLLAKRLEEFQRLRHFE